jgi:hypothetical protein
MSSFIKKSIGLLVVLSFSVMSIPFAFAQSTTIDCGDAAQLPDVGKAMNAQNANFVATEIYEPLGGFEDKVAAGDVIVSQVWWKFSCSTTQESIWLDGEDSPGKQPPGDKTNVSGYVPYGTDCPANYNECALVQIIIGQSGTAILKTYVAILYRWAAGLVGIVAVLVIVISGIQISTDQGSGEGVGAAKTRIIQALSGLVILFLSGLILYTINPTFFQ